MAQRTNVTLAILFFIFSCNCREGEKAATNVSQALNEKEVKQIAKESYIALFPLVYNYGTMYKQAINKDAKEYLGGFGLFKHYDLATPENKDIPTPNNNTPYSWAWVDLRHEPWVLTMPPADSNRYYVSQWDDLWGYVIDAPGSILDGQGGGNYLLVTKDYKGQIPKNIKRAIFSESQFIGTLTRTGVQGQNDLKTMQLIQEGYRLQPLSSFTDSEPPTRLKDPNWPIFNKGDLSTINFFKYANFMLTYILPCQADQKMLENAKKIGVSAGTKWIPEEMDSAFVSWIKAGIQAASKEIEQQVARTKNGNKLYNTREVIGEDYLNRTVGVIVGQFGNYPHQAIYPSYQKDQRGSILDGSKGNYTLTFAPGELPEAKYFWSFTMYDLPNRLLVDNPINRYNIGSQNSSLKKNADGSLTLYFQNNSPGKDKESNWLPAPKGPFYVVLRIYGPDKNMTSGNYQFPDMIRIAKSD